MFTLYTNKGKLPDGWTATKYYNIEDSTFLLPEPTKTGYEFMGWYKTSKFRGEPVTTIEQGTTGAMKLYARWKKTT